MLHGGTQRLRRLAEDVSAVSPIEEGLVQLRPTVMSPRRLLESAATTARESYDGRQVRVVTTAAPTRNVRVDPERLPQVLGNLLENALRHTPAGGVHTLSATAQEENWVELSVTDTGAGIAPEHLFERFYRADPARPRGYAGSGIGLTISWAIIESHGGGLSAASAGTGKGATFTMRLPAWLP